MAIKPTTVDEYIAGFPKEVQDILEQVRATVKAAAPQAEEEIKYNIPTLIYKGNLISFAAFTNHIGLYPTPEGDEAFEKAITPFKSGKSSIQLPLDKPMPLNLITQIVKLRVEKMDEVKRK